MSHGNSIGPSNVLASENQGSAPAQSRFAYASGSQPLDGYTIKRGIGVGGFGEVYYATSDAGKDVALKRIQRNLDVELRGVRQCLNLKHANLLALYDIKHDQEGQSWVVMEYVPGENLQEVVERNPNGVPFEQVHFWFEGLAAGVSYLHDCGIVHRDLKPGNIFLDSSAVKIGDYGLSKFISCSRRSGQTQSVGTFHYMAPEIGQGRYGKEIDIYALGIMLYEMLTGHVPYEGESSQEIIMKHLTAQPDLRAVPDRYRDIIELALAKDPESRFRSVAEMREMMASRDPSNSVKSTESIPVAAVMPARIGEKVVPPIMATPVDTGRAAPAGLLADEPVAQAVSSGWQHMRRRWKSANLGTLPKIVLLGGGLFLLMTNASWLIPWAISLGFAYCLYFAVRALVLANTPNPAIPKPSGPAVTLKANKPAPNSDSVIMAQPAQKPQPRRGRPRPVDSKPIREQHLRAALARIPYGEQAADLTGAYLMSALVAAVVGIVMLLLRSDVLQGSVYGWLPTYAWTTLTSVVGVWSILLLGKMWERSPGDPALRRFTMLVVGMFVGAVSYGIAQFLIVRPTYVLAMDQSLMSGIPTAFHTIEGLPTFAGYLAYFGALLFVLRWWKQADPLRHSRLSVWSTIVTVAVAIVLHALCPFPHGFVVAATMSVALQLSAPWMAPVQRKQEIASLRQR